MQKNEYTTLIQSKIQSANRVLVGLGGEWKAEGGLSRPENEKTARAYQALFELLKGKDYFIITTLTDGSVYEAGFADDRVVAPCGNVHWKQCPDACTTDIWEEGEVADGNCPHCGKKLISNTMASEHYLEEGYLIRWKKYQLWLSTTLNRELAVLELGEGFLTPTVIRWPFEKTVMVNQKAWMCRINQEFYQIPGDIKDKSLSIAGNSVSFFAD